MNIDLDHLRSWIGKKEIHHDTATAFPVQALAATLAAQGGLDVESHFGLGVPAEAIDARVKATQAGLVVVARRSDPGAAGASGTVMRVLRSAPCPLLVVRTRAAAAYHRVLTAVDLREVSLRAAIGQRVERSSGLIDRLTR